MATKFSLAGKAATVSGVLLLLSFGLCGIGGTGLNSVGGSAGQSLSSVSLMAGLVCLGLGLVGLVVTFVLLVVGAVRESSSTAAVPPGISPPPPPRVQPQDTQPPDRDGPTR